MKNILLIDDDKIIRELFKYILKDYTLTTISSFPELTSINPNDYDLIISDFNIDAYNGLDVLKYLLNHKYKNPVIMNSGNENCKDIIENSHYYPLVKAYLTKTEDVLKIRETIKKVLGE